MEITLHLQKDLALVKNFLYPYEIHSIPELSSDHNPAILNFYFKYTFPNLQSNVKTNWKKFTDNLINSDNFNAIEMNTPEQLDEAIFQFEKHIMDAKIAASKSVPADQTYIDPTIRQLNNERNHARKMYQRTRNPDFNRLAGKLNKKIIRLNEKIENNSFTNKLVNVATEEGTLWEFVRPFKKKFKNISALNGPSSIALTDKDKANCLASSLEKQFQLNDTHDADTELLVKISVEGFRPPNKFKFNDITPPLPYEIKNCIKKLKINKAPGNDKINNKMLKCLPDNYIYHLTLIIYKIMTIGHFPTKWKTATVIPILKPGKDPTQPSSHRPISLLSAISKIAEHIILDRLHTHLETNNILCPEQFGFRKNLSTTHQLIRVVEFIEEAFNNKQKTGAVFLDIQKAFD
ncbi:putative RNA-directed DNA polymerase from transposon X-element [Araneus ventricosus]|uniref:Putative RNA-directed DNA polymerase from transposon X-element n=1 Tax=Araneus ventricosus TaxID=182803 RepID=A0A4Y2T2M7_ARAVE|nr:putative RNA-directed DNA polymerase from transposon X-element [Araneus ventricosus]